MRTVHGLTTAWRGLLVGLAVLLSGVAAGADENAWRQDFENRLPGETPEGWGKAWGGGLLEDVFATSNLEALTGTRALMLERQTSEAPVLYALARVTPRLASAEANLVIPFFIRSPAAYGASFSIELRSSSGRRRLAVLSVRAGIASLQRGDFKQGAPLGGVELSVWHRFVVRLPLEAPSDGRGNRVAATLERRTDAGSGLWTPSGARAEVDGLLSVEPDRRLSIQLTPGLTGAFQLFIDDLEVRGLK